MAAAPIRPLAWEPPYATGETLEKAKRQKKKKKKKKIGAQAWESPNAPSVDICDGIIYFYEIGVNFSL